MNDLEIIGDKERMEVPRYWRMKKVLYHPELTGYPGCLHRSLVDRPTCLECSQQESVVESEKIVAVGLLGQTVE